MEIRTIQNNEYLTVQLDNVTVPNVSGYSVAVGANGKATLNLSITLDADYSEVCLKGPTQPNRKAMNVSP